MSESQNVLVKEFINELTNCLKEDKFNEALQLFQNNTYDDIIKEFSWDIVPIVSSHLAIESKECNDNKIECCTAILDAVVQKCNPSETVLELLEQVEDSENDVKFCVILKVLTKCLSKMDDKMKAIEWCISTIRSYIDSISRSEVEPQCINAIINRIQTVYSAVLSFLQPLIDETSLSSTKKSIALRDYLVSILIFMMGKPLCYLPQKELTSHSELPLPEKILTLISCINGDLLQYLNIVSVRSKKTKFRKRKIEEGCNNLKVILFELEENVPNLAYSNFYFYIITKLNLWKRVPQVYDSKYIFEACTYFVITLLQEEEGVQKGLKFMEQLLKKIPKYSLTSELLELNIYLELFDALSKIMIYYNRDKERKKALKIFQEYIRMFDMEARYFIVLHLYHTSEHSGLLSLTTGILKTSIIECLQATPPIPHFIGKNLESLIKLACKLPHGSTSDLVELSDEIITSLNLLRFLFLRDKYNQTGIWNLTETLENNYLKPLREGIDLCRAHWRVKMKDLEVQNKRHKITEDIELEKGDTEVTLTVGGEKLPAMPISEKISFCYQVLNSLDVMESILIRVNECIANNEFKQDSLRSLWTCRTLLSDQNVNTQHSSQEHSKESDEEYEKNIKSKILAASLKYVHDLGWSQQAISAGAESIGYPGVIHGLFPNRGADLVQYFYLTCNKELNEILQKRVSDAVDNKENKILELQIRDAVETRLRMVIPYKRTWPQALALMTLPPNVPMSLANLLILVDDICYYTGDRSVDVNWYTRRVVLAGIYKTTELYMLQDNSEDHQKTWNFLERRIKDATQIHSILTATTDMPLPEQAISRATEAATAAFVTARNILGLNWNR